MNWENESKCRNFLKGERLREQRRDVQHDKGARKILGRCLGKACDLRKQTTKSQVKGVETDS